MKLQILIPQYNETDEIIKPMLDSLLIQQNVDFNEFGVIIVNDGSNIMLSNELLSKYPFRIDYYKAPHRGVSATRNTCLDYAQADYVMFCDADDMFFNACGLYLIFREIDIGFETLSSMFIEEGHTPEGKIVYINKENDSVFVHGKVHNRQFLINNGIRWNPNLTIHEDSFFNIQCQRFAKQPKYLNTAFYLWRWRPESVCRKDPKYILKTYPQMIDSVDALNEELEKRGKHDAAVEYTVFILFSSYYLINSAEWRDKENMEYLNKLEYRCYQFFKKYQKLWCECSMESAMVISQKIRADKIAQKTLLLEDISMKEWLNKIITTYQNVDEREVTNNG